MGKRSWKGGVGWGQHPQQGWARRRPRCLGNRRRPAPAGQQRRRGSGKPPTAVVPPPGGQTHKVPPALRDAAQGAGPEWTSVPAPGALAQAQSPRLGTAATPSHSFLKLLLGGLDHQVLSFVSGAGSEVLPAFPLAPQTVSSSLTGLCLLLERLLAPLDDPSAPGAERTRGPATDWAVPGRGAVPTGGALGRRRESLFSAEDWR